MNFFRQKQERLQHADLSRKGSIDEFIVETVEKINSLSNYFTTSSCSGRIIILESTVSEEESSTKFAQKSNAKKGCKWLLVSHDKICMEFVEKGMMSVTNEAIFKFEPMVMHIQCQSLKDAQILHQAAVAAGFRNSGISIGNKGKTMVHPKIAVRERFQVHLLEAVRSTHGLEVPLSSNGVILVSKQYLEFLVDCANKKMDENFSRINRFLEEINLISDGDRHSGSCNLLETDNKDTTKQNKSLNAKKREIEQNGQDHQEMDEHFMDQDLSLFIFENT